MRPSFERPPLAEGQSWTLLDRRLPDGIPFQWHYHREFELTLTSNSRGQRFVGDHVAPYDDGDLVLLGPNVPHTWASAGKIERGLPHVALVLWFRPEWIEALIGGTAELASLAPLLAASVRGLRFSDPVAAAARPLIEGMPRLDPPKRLFRLLELLVMVSGDAAATPLTSPEARQSPIRGLARPRIERVLDHLHGHYVERQRIDALADLANLSASGLHRMFKRHTRFTVSEYLAQLRIGRACQLLITTDQPVAHIAQSVGYENLSNFNRQFRAAKGCAPRAFRRGFRGPSAGAGSSHPRPPADR